MASSRPLPSSSEQNLDNNKGVARRRVAKQAATDTLLNLPQFKGADGRPTAQHASIVFEVLMAYEIENRFKSPDYENHTALLIEMVYAFKVKKVLEVNAAHFTDATEVERILLDSIRFRPIDVKIAMEDFETKQPTKPYDLQHIAHSIMIKRAERLRESKPLADVADPQNDADDVDDSEKEAKYNASAVEPTPTPVPAADFALYTPHDEDDEPTVTEIDNEFTTQGHIAALPEQKHAKASSISSNGSDWRLPDQWRVAWNLGSPECRTESRIVVTVVEDDENKAEPNQRASDPASEHDDNKEDEAESLVSPKDDESESPNTKALAEEEKDGSIGREPESKQQQIAEDVVERIPARPIHCTRKQMKPRAGWKKAETCAQCKSPFDRSFIGNGGRNACPLCKRVLCGKLACFGGDDCPSHMVEVVVDGVKKKTDVCRQCMVDDFNRSLQ